MKKAILIVGAIILAAAIAAGSFYGGMAYQSNQASAIRNNFMSARGIDGSNFPGLPGDGNNPAGGGANTSAGGFGGPSGQIKSIDGNTVVLSTPQNEVKVTLSDSTVVQKSGAGVVSDLQPGQRVMVTGQRDANGNLTAVQVLILGEAQSDTNANP